MLFHIHKWEILNDRQLRCSKCGDIKNVPCPHKFETISQIEQNLLGYTYVIIQCKKCGIIEYKMAPPNPYRS
jgi:rRNA maturation protein Nop10